MLNVISENISSILTGFFTLGSSALTLYITNHFSAKKQKKELYREKLEKAFSLLTMIYGHVVNLPIKMVSLEQEKSEVDKNGATLSGELYMIISCYAPPMLITHQSFMHFFAETCRLIIQKQTDSDEYVAQMQAFTKILHDFQKALQSEIKKYN